MGAVSALERNSVEKTNPVKILSLDAKDIWLSNHSTPSAVGYRIRDKNGEIVLRKFTNDLDYSLELKKLRETYQKVYCNNRFSFFRDKKEHTQQVINVTFLYNNKE